MKKKVPFFRWIQFGFSVIVLMSAIMKENTIGFGGLCSGMKCLIVEYNKTYKNPIVKT